MRAHTHREFRRVSYPPEGVVDTPPGAPAKPGYASLANSGGLPHIKWLAYTGVYLSGQKGRTVNPLAYAFVGSNPTAPNDVPAESYRNRLQVAEIAVVSPPSLDFGPCTLDEPFARTTSGPFPGPLFNHPRYSPAGDF